jgi:hypothetical protein
VVSHVGSGGVAHVSHCSTVERLYAWEKKLFIEVKVWPLWIIFCL